MFAAASFPPLADTLRAHARRGPASPALVVPAATLPGARQRWCTVTFAELDARSEALAAGLAGLGLVPGTRVALLVPPTPDFFALAYGLLKAAVVPVLVDPGIGTRRLRECLAEAAPRAFIGVGRAHLARALLEWCPDAPLAVRVGGGPLGGGPTLAEVEEAGRMRLEGGGWTAPAVAPEQLAAVAFTSGSTGTPKGVEYQHRHLAAQVALIRALYDIQPGVTNLATFPPFGLFGPALGMTTVVPRMDPTRPARVRPERLVDAAARFGATMMFGSPALLDTVGRWGERTGGKLPGIRCILSAGAPVPPRVLRRILAMLPEGAEVFTPYGATECLPVTHVGSREVLELTAARTGICVGRPVPGVDVAVMRISDGPVPTLTADDFVPVGTVGEVVARGPNVTLAYHGRPEATARAKTQWEGRPAHRMGDLGWLDAEGRLWFAGRKVHRVRTAAGTLFSVCVEEVFNAHPRVSRTALVGVGAPGAQVPVLCVEPEPGVRGDAGLTRELLALGGADAQGTGAARVRRVLYHPGFPVDIRHNSKIDRERLAAWASRRLPPEEG